MAALPQISRERLWEKIAGGEEFVLVDALSPMSYALSHLPGAVNITPDGTDRWAPVRIPDKSVDVVVYCANPECESSIEVGDRLLELGYRSVYHYAGGKEEWVDAGLPLEGRKSRA
jgi:rhodanese-related sulfurtransferase